MNRSFALSMQFGLFGQKFGKFSTQVKCFLVESERIHGDEEMLKFKLKLIGCSFIISTESHFRELEEGKELLSSQ